MGHVSGVEQRELLLEQADMILRCCEESVPEQRDARMYDVATRRWRWRRRARLTVSGHGTTRR